MGLMVRVGSGVFPGSVEFGCRPACKHGSSHGGCGLGGSRASTRRAHAWNCRRRSRSRSATRQQDRRRQARNPSRSPNHTAHSAFTPGIPRLGLEERRRPIHGVPENLLKLDRTVHPVEMVVGLEFGDVETQHGRGTEHIVDFVEKMHINDA